MSGADATARALDGIPLADLLVGTFVSANADGTVKIDFGQGAVSCMSAGSFEPLPGVSVRCIQLDAGMVMIGPAAPRPSIGIVTATTTPALGVQVGADVLQLPYVTSYTPRAISDVVLIDWAAGGVVVGKVSAAPSASYTPPAGAVQDYSADFVAADSGSYQSGGWWTNEVWCSVSNQGAWFYGSAIADTIPDGATILAVSLFVMEFYNQFPTSLATIGLHGLPSKSGAPGVSGAATISRDTGWKPLPTSYGDALKTGAAFGVGTNHGGFHKFTARASSASSGLLRIDWRV